MATRRYLPAAAAGVLFLAIAAIYAAGYVDLYDAILRPWGVQPWAFPFLDTDGVISAARCLRDGVDVINDNPCDPLRRPFNYSPLWLLLAKLPVTQAWLVPAGLILAVSLIASLLLLPEGRTPAATAVIVLGAISPPMVFVIERGNTDIAVFVLAAAAAALASRTPVVRLAGYAAALLAALLKYYPITLMVMATRERPLRFLGIVLVSLAVVAVFFFVSGDDILRTWQLIPGGGWFNDMMGSRTLPGGLSSEYDWPAGRAATLHTALVVLALAGGVAIGLRPSVGEALQHLTEAERMALLAGGVLTITCFFGARNVGYRFMHLLLVLPALTALWQLRVSRLFTVTTFTVLALLWSQAWLHNWIRRLLPARPPFVTMWVVRELLWWVTITVLIGIVLALIARSEMGQRVFRRRSIISAVPSALPPSVP